jgi:hypothetical protein
MKNLFLIPTDKPSRLFKSFGKLNIGDYITSREDLQVTNQNIYITSDEAIFIENWVIANNGLLAKVTTEFTWHFINSKKIILTTDQDLIADGVQSIDNKFLEWFVKNPSCEKVKVSELRFFNPDTNESAHCKWEYDLPQEEPKQKKWDTLNKELDDALEEEFGSEEPKQETLENSKLALREYILANKEKVTEDLQEMREKSGTGRDETLEKAAEKRYVEGVYVINGIDICDASRECFIAGAKWQAERMYSEEEVIELLTARCKHFGTTMTPFRELLLKQDLEWFEENKKKIIWNKQQ